MKKTAIIALAFVLFSAGVSLAGPFSITLDNGAYNSVPEPRLRYPIYDTVTINDNQPLEFSWWNDVVNISGFVLKIYKGYNMYADNLLLKENLPADASTFAVKAELFEDGKVYTWSLVRVAFGGYKSDRSFNSFKVIKGTVK